MRRCAVFIGLLALVVVPFTTMAPAPALANNYSFTASGPWASSDGVFSGTWQAHFDVAGFDLTGTLNILGLPDVGEGNIAGSWDLNNIGFGVMFLDHELASFTGGLQGGKLVGTFEHGDITGIWSGALSSFSITNSPIVPIINATLPTLLLSQGNGSFGDFVSLAATLYTLGAPIAKTQNLINFDPFNTPIAKLANGKPDCSINPFIGKADSLFQFLPQGCSGTACNQVLAIVQSLSDLSAIPDGSMLYTCRVKIPTQAVTGIYQLVASALSAIDTSNIPLPIASLAGQIGVKEKSLIKQIKSGCHCSTVETAGTLPLSSLLAPLLIIGFRRLERRRSALRN